MYGFESIKDARKAVGVSQRDAAEILGVSRATIQNWERGSIELNDIQRDIFIRIIIESRRLVKLLILEETICLEAKDNNKESIRVFQKDEYEYVNSLLRYYCDNGYRIEVIVSATNRKGV